MKYEIMYIEEATAAIGNLTLPPWSFKLTGCLGNLLSETWTFLKEVSVKLYLKPLMLTYFPSTPSSIDILTSHLYDVTQTN